MEVSFHPKEEDGFYEIDLGAQLYGEAELYSFLSDFSKCPPMKKIIDVAFYLETFIRYQEYKSKKRYQKLIMKFDRLASFLDLDKDPV